MKKQILSTLILSICACLTLSAQDNNQSYDTNRGFIHPGGLHTQQDFDRIKQQLEEGNKTVKEAYNVLKTAGYAQAGVVSYPVETIVRGGGVGENYMNAARAATMAYQNALRWKIEDNKACAKTAVDILMAWAKVTKVVGGDTNYALAAGLYGYQFAQAAELVRDYEGWNSEDFQFYKQWMLEVWYPASIGFLRARCGTWENGGKWWHAPGHYWSNWGLCNALCVISIGLLCDDVYIYNQGMSYFKYDQVGNFNDPPILYEITGHGEYDGQMCIHNDGLNEFLGNLVVTHVESDLETAAYGKLGQMNESGRDAGHAAMALGLAIDIAKVGWNQGDDLFAYMDHRLAAGIEYLAAQTQSVENLPWTNYLYANNGIYYTDGRSQLMIGPAMGAHIRPCWGTVIGIYEGVKGVKMPFSELALRQMGIDGGGAGGTSGGYDQLGYSVLMNFRNEQICPQDKIPTELKGRIEYDGTINANLMPSTNVEKKLGNIDGKIINHNELGGLVNSYITNVNTGVPIGQKATLMPQLPEGEQDTGKWIWNTGETTRNISVNTDKSFVYRVTYTNSNGVESQLCFPIAVAGDCIPTRLVPTITYNKEDYNTNNIDIIYGKAVTLKVDPRCIWGTYKWSNNSTEQSISVNNIKEDQTFTVTYTNQGGAQTTMDFNIHVLMGEPYTILDGVTKEGTEIVVEQGGTVTLGINTPISIIPSKVSWSDGTKGTKTLTIENIQESGEYTASYTMSGVEYSFKFLVLVNSKEPPIIEPGNYLIVNDNDGLLLTAKGNNELVCFEDGSIENPAPEQTWFIDNKEYKRYAIVSMIDDLALTTAAKTMTTKLYSFYFNIAAGTDRYAMHTGTSASTIKYWTVDKEGNVNINNTKLDAFPFRLIKVGTVADNINDIKANTNTNAHIYDISGRRITKPTTGIYIQNGKKFLINN